MFTCDIEPFVPKYGDCKTLRITIKSLSKLNDETCAYFDLQTGAAHLNHLSKYEFHFFNFFASFWKDKEEMCKVRRDYWRPSIRPFSWPHKRHFNRSTVAQMAACSPHDRKVVGSKCHERPLVRWSINIEHLYHTFVYSPVSLLSGIYPLPVINYLPRCSYQLL